MLNLISDSSCDLRAFELSGPQVRLQVIPMHLHIDHKDFPDDENLNLREMLEAIAKAPSSTACPSPQAFADAFAQGDESICVTISSPLSGTYQAAVTGRELALAENPEKKVASRSRMDSPSNTILYFPDSTLPAPNFSLTRPTVRAARSPISAAVLPTAKSKSLSDSSPFLSTGAT